MGHQVPDEEAGGDGAFDGVGPHELLALHTQSSDVSVVEFFEANVNFCLSRGHVLGPPFDYVTHYSMWCWLHA